MSRIADIIRKFDVVAIQKSDQPTTTSSRLIDYINADGMQYEYLLGPRLGHTSAWNSMLTCTTQLASSLALMHLIP
ncbi:MAG: hypothetical protein U0905_20355 [Pirellulales bacterium]